jgi:hypothetical protein
MEDSKNFYKVRQIKSYKNVRGIFHVGAVCVCLLLLPNTRSDLPKGLLYGADLQELVGTNNKCF